MRLFQKKQRSGTKALPGSFHKQGGGERFGTGGENSHEMRI